jgi:hypothetical protein
MADLPPDWQARMVDMIRGSEPLDGAWFAGGPTLDPLAQIGVYREQYRLRIWDALTEDVAGLLALLGDDADAVLWAYLDANPPDGWTLARLADRLPEWLAATDRPTAWAEMAALDRAVQHGFVAADGRIPRPDELQAALGGTGTLGLQPHVRLLRFTTSVHRARSAVLNGEALPELVPGPFCVAVYRGQGHAMRHIEMEPAAFAVLEALRDGRGLEAAVMAALAVLGNPEVLMTRLQGWFALFTERGLLELRP